MSSESKVKPQRVLVVDAVRGAAVLCMIQWHCADCWIRHPERDGTFFDVTEIVGGLAAPLFLLLAGVSAALVYEPGRGWAGARRGAGILVGGYAFKLFAWAVDYGALTDPRDWPAIALDALGLTLAWQASLEKITPTRRALLAGGATLAWGATALALRFATRTPELIVRLDVLQGIGVALIVVQGVLALATRTKAAPLVLLGLAGMVALATPSFVGADLSFLPTRLADYVARTVPYPEPSGARFPLFPWLGYTLLGAALGRAVRARPSADAWAVPFTRSPMLALSLAVVVAACVFEPSPVARWLLGHTEQIRNLLRLAWNGSIATGIAALASMTLPRAAPAQRVMLSLGRHSLVVYVVHLEIAFGLPGSTLRQSLGLPAWAALTAALTASMVGLAFWLDAREAARRATR